MADEVAEDASLVAYILETIAYLSLRRGRRESAEQLAALAYSYSRRSPGFEQLVHDEVSEHLRTLQSESLTVPPNPADALGFAKAAVERLITEPPHSDPCRIAEEIGSEIRPAQ